ncbi:rCG59701 [Rattus norvegicus]|uniref:RCG59701 n=1 Tax=Rattus norvegicus TaxID=10116 RepID=A6HSG6_RAT|nr:rCG59701 [Rattus norvegicus]
MLRHLYYIKKGCGSHSLL